MYQLAINCIFESSLCHKESWQLNVIQGRKRAHAWISKEMKGGVFLTIGYYLNCSVYDASRELFCDQILLLAFFCFLEPTSSIFTWVCNLLYIIHVIQPVFLREINQFDQNMRRKILSLLCKERWERGWTMSLGNKEGICICFFLYGGLNLSDCKSSVPNGRLHRSYPHPNPIFTVDAFTPSLQSTVT